MSLIQIDRALCKAVAPLRFADPVKYVYNPLEYARAPHEDYLAKFGAAPREALLLGMNPGPFGMAQTGVPFGEVALVRDWMGVRGKVAKPDPEHPKRPVQGFGCPRSEVSGARLWGWAKERFGAPEKFFARFFVINYCPLVFMAESSRNITPDKLPAAEREALFAACDTALRAAVSFLKPRIVIGVGAFARKRAEEACAKMDVSFGQVLHPSPASPAANRGWAEAAEKDFKACGVSI